MITRKSRNRISPLRRRFAGLIVDVCYDHFLSRHWRHFGTTDLKSFVDRVYAVLIKNRSLLPERLRRILLFMIRKTCLGVTSTWKKWAMRSTVSPAVFPEAAVHARHHRNRIQLRCVANRFLAFFPDLTVFVETRRALALKL